MEITRHVEQLERRRSVANSILGKTGNSNLNATHFPGNQSGFMDLTRMEKERGDLDAASTSSLPSSLSSNDSIFAPCSKDFSQLIKSSGSPDEGSSMEMTKKPLSSIPALEPGTSVPSAEKEIEEEMEFTCKLPVPASSKEVSQPSDAERSVVMEMTKPLPSVRVEIPALDTRGSASNTEKETEAMELTCKLPISASSKELSQEPSDAERSAMMEMTRPLPSLRVEKDGVTAPAAEVEEAFHDDSITTRQPLPSVPALDPRMSGSSTEKETEAMELTCKLPVSASSKEVSQPSDTERSVVMEMTKPLPSVKVEISALDTRGSASNTEKETEAMELTCKLPVSASSKELSQEPSDAERSVMMDMTRPLPSLRPEKDDVPASAAKENEAFHDDSITTRPFPSIPALDPRMSGSSTEKKTEEAMEFTCKIPTSASSEKFPQPSDADRSAMMEMTKPLPSLRAEKDDVPAAKTSSTAKRAEEAMEITCRVAISASSTEIAQPSDAEGSVAMEMTKPLPSVRALDAKPSALNARKEEEMEMTDQIPVHTPPSAKETSAPLVADDVSKVSMEMTRPTPTPGGMTSISPEVSLDAVMETTRPTPTPGGTTSTSPEVSLDAGMEMTRPTPTPGGMTSTSPEVSLDAGMEMTRPTPTSGGVTSTFPEVTLDAGLEMTKSLSSAYKQSFFQKLKNAAGADAGATTTTVSDSNETPEFVDVEDDDEVTMKVPAKLSRTLESIPDFERVKLEKTASPEKGEEEVTNSEMDDKEEEKQEEQEAVDPQEPECISIFEHLHRASADSPWWILGLGRWRLEEANEWRAKFSFLHGAVALNLSLGHARPSERVRGDEETRLDSEQF